jgi:hypothetical protein
VGEDFEVDAGDLREVLAEELTISGALNPSLQRT